MENCEMSKLDLENNAELAKKVRQDLLDSFDEELEEEIDD